MDNKNCLHLPNYFKDVVDKVIDNENLRNHVVSCELGSGKGENYLGVIYRVTVKGKDVNGEEKDFRLILKVPSELDSHRENLQVTKYFRFETFAYNYIHPAFNCLQDKFNITGEERIHFVKCYKTGSEIRKEFLLLEDVCASNFRLAERRVGLEYSHVKVVLLNMAKLHALSFALKKQDPEAYSFLADNTGNSYNFEGEMVQNLFSYSANRAVNSIEDIELKEKFRCYVCGKLQMLKKHVDPHFAAPYTVLCHGDCWVNNIMFKYKDATEEVIDCRLLDWQLIKHSSPVLDISYFFFTSTDYELRKNHFQELMDYYYEALKNALFRMDLNIEDTYPWHIFQEHLKRFFHYGLLMGLIVLPLVVGEVNDALDLAEFTSKEKMERINGGFNSEEGAKRFSSRMEGLVKTSIEMGLF